MRSKQESRASDRATASSWIPMRADKRGVALNGRLLGCLAPAVAFALAMTAAVEGRAESAFEANARAVDQAFQLELTKEGLDSAADILRRRGLGESIAANLPDVQNDLPLGVSLRLAGLRLTGEVPSLELVPQSGNLSIKVGLHNVQVAIGTLEVTKKTFFGNIGTTCRNTKINLAEQDRLLLQMAIKPTVEDANIELFSESVTFPVSSDNFRVRGPESCTGLLTGTLTRLAMHQVIKLVRPMLATLVRQNIEKVLPEISALINAQTHLSVIQVIRGLPSLPQRVAEISTYPTSLAIDKSALKVALGFKVEEITALKRPPNLELSQAFHQGVRYGSLGLNPGVVTAAFQALWPEGGDLVDLGDDIASLLDVTSFNAVWPDLDLIPLTAQNLRLKARLGAPPELSTDHDLDFITARLPLIELVLQVNLEHTWRDYFVIDLAVASGATLAVNAGSLAITPLKSTKVALSGHWASTYTPVDATFHQDVAEMITQSLVEAVTGGQPLTEFALPKISVGGIDIELGHPHIDGPFVALDLVGR